MTTVVRRLLALLALLATPAFAVTVDRIAATVDRQVLTVSEITQMVEIRFFSRTAESDDDHRRDVLDALIAQALRFRDVERFGAQDISADVIEARLLEIQRRFPTEAEFLAAVARAELTLDEVRALVKRQLQVEAYIQERFAPLVFISNEEIDDLLPRHLDAAAARARSARPSPGRGAGRGPHRCPRLAPGGRDRQMDRATPRAGGRRRVRLAVSYSPSDTNARNSSSSAPPRRAISPSRASTRRPRRPRGSWFSTRRTTTVLPPSRSMRLWISSREKRVRVPVTTTVLPARRSPVARRTCVGATPRRCIFSMRSRLAGTAK